MSITSVNAVGTKIATRIRQAGFDPRDIEALMYLGKEAVPMNTFALKKSTWSQIAWHHLNACAGDKSTISLFPINGTAVSVNRMDYLLALAVLVTMPQVTLANTPAPQPFTVAFIPTDVTIPPDVEEIQEAGEPLFFYLSDGTLGFPAFQIFVGTFLALTSDPEDGGLGIPADLVRPFVSYAPRHRVGWGDHAALAAIRHAAFLIDGEDNNMKLDSHAIYNALETRMREDVYPVAGFEATSMKAVMMPAGVGNGCHTTLDDCEDLQKAFVLPFSFTTSALADRGENGKHKSAFPVLYACTNNLALRLKIIDDIRKLLVLEEECLMSFADQPIIFVARPQELALSQTNIPTVNLFFTDGCSIWELLGSGLLPSNPENLALYFSTSESFVIVNNGRSVTYGPTSPFHVSDFGVLFLEQSGEYLPVTRKDKRCNSSLCKDFDYGCWIKECKLCPSIGAKALTAYVTDLERGMMKSDCRGKKWMYERYYYFKQFQVNPGDNPCVRFDTVPGQVKYAFTFAQNNTSRLQGHFFNYTNSTDYEIILDDDLNRPKWVFNGGDSLEKATSKVQGSSDGSFTSAFLRYVDNPLMEQRAPRRRGLHIVPRYNNFINAIYPDGSTKPYFTDPTVTVKTTPACCFSCPISTWFKKPNTCSYNVYVIVVAVGFLTFTVIDQCGGFPGPYGGGYQSPIPAQAY